MTKATSSCITRTAAAPEFADVIARFRAIAAASGDRLLLGDGPPHPDAELLELCAEIADRRIAGTQQIEELELQARATYATSCAAQLNQPSPELRDIRERQRAIRHGIGQMLRRAGKLSSTTPAGIYAKAIAIRASETGAALLAKSLADDLVACPGLRAVLWPAAGDAP